MSDSSLGMKKGKVSGIFTSESLGGVNMDVQVTAPSHAADYTVLTRKAMSHVDMVPVHLGQTMHSYFDCNSNEQYHMSVRVLIKHGWIAAIKVNRKCPL